MPANHSEPVKNQTDSPEDQIELIELLRVIWKWKYLITGGTVICVLAATIISLNMAKVYSIETVIRPGILSIGKGGDKNFIDTPLNIKTLIEAGTFENEILNSLGKSSMDDIPKVLKFKITLAKNSNTLKVSYESPLIEQGIEILDYLCKLLIDEYQNLVKHYHVEIDRDIHIKKAEIQNITTMKKSNESNTKNIEKRISELETEIDLINKNTTSLNIERKKFLLQEKNESNILSAILYANTIQQNLQLANDYKDEITNLRLKKEEELQKISNLEKKFKELILEIDGLEFQKDSIQNIRIVQKPYSRINPIKPKKKLIVILATFTGVFMMVFLSFFLEYITKNRMKKSFTKEGY